MGLMHMSKKGDLIIHIGPPKTATTSLQIFLQQLQLDDFIYGGIVQPRNKEPHSICSLLYTDIASGCFNNKEKVTYAIDRCLNEDKVFFMSEECFLLESTKVSWEEKIKHITKYFEGFEPTMVFTVREPKKAIISFYHEIYNSLSKNYQNDFKMFLESRYCNIYKYKSLYSFLKSYCGAVKFIEFEKLVSGECYLSDLTGKDNEHNIRLAIGKENVSINKKEQYFTKPITLRNKIARSFSSVANRSFLKQLKGKGLGRKIYSFIPNIEILSKNLGLDFDQYDYYEFKNEYKYMQQILMGMSSS